MIKSSSKSLACDLETRGIDTLIPTNILTPAPNSTFAAYRFNNQHDEKWEEQDGFENQKQMPKLYTILDDYWCMVLIKKKYPDIGIHFSRDFT